MIKPSLRGVTPTSFGGLAVFLQVTGCLGFILMFMMILMQIRFGGAGRKWAANVDTSGVKTVEKELIQAV